MILTTKKGVKFSLSDGNKKIGMVCNFSVMPGPSCPADIPCYKTCYAMKMIRQSGNHSWIGVKKSWAMNTAAVLADPAGIAAVLADTVGTQLFRWNVGGDFGLPGYWQLACRAAELRPDVQFFAYTKFFDLLKLDRPDNFNLIASVWGNYRPAADPSTYAASYFKDGDKFQIPGSAFSCPGNCAICKKCAFMRPGQSVFFEKH